MNNFQKGLFDKLQKNANINPEDVYKVADSVKHANFKDEQTVRNLVKQLSQMANKPLSKEREDKIVQSIVNNNMPSDMNSLNKLFKK
ncbi:MULTISPECIES: stage VI sporulation protein F [Oceanobacillus]|uniref:Stage VI sporulation protein F n=1 Tax=Oceanobacillus kimchii TaxID=746691 RepID=A0ABQ5TJH4_9BACI|nr:MULTISPECIES: stage VI sporulation protein F [Oceanobacillus]MBT2598452.1 stage VI sporulation protein F [Oceanobacillus sp. ISL-74]MBT2651370.1 stage VI sporulation protein F [Oceanobacillus sp. ISL-73]MCT1576029.1 stage VI sporulation protein F [Oceanobacillus kimchii]MCT2135666.1 stage VI sporulation protein F [Oceanobacillus kimchii]OEH55764.1 ATP synthase [Oceanobacillus sp. E9]